MTREQELREALDRQLAAHDRTIAKLDRAVAERTRLQVETASLRETREEFRRDAEKAEAELARLRELLDKGQRFAHKPDKSCEPNCARMWEWAEAARAALSPPTPEEEK
jgi:hypothetical protein